MKKSDKSQLCNIVWNTLPVVLKTVKVIKAKEILRNWCSQEEPEGDVLTYSDGGLDWALGQEEGMSKELRKSK